MNFHDWIAMRVLKEKRTKTAILRELGKKAGVSLLTLQHLEKDGKLSRYEKAKALERATEGAVTAQELCE
jgi:hypothetical protein